MLNNNNFNKYINQMNNFQDNNNGNNNNFFNILKNINDNNNSREFTINSINNKFIANNYNGNNNNMFGNLNNDLHFDNIQNKNNLNFFNKEKISNNNSEVLFTEEKKNVSIFGNKLKNSPLFANNLGIENKNENINFRFDDYVSKDKSIFGNRLKEKKPLFTNFKNHNSISLNDQNISYIENENIAHLNNKNNNYMNFNYDQKDFMYLYNSCNNNDSIKNVNSEINEKNNLVHDVFNPISLNIKNNSNIKSISSFGNNTITNTSTDLSRCNDINPINYNSFQNTMNYPYLHYNTSNKDTINPNGLPFNEQNVISAQANLVNQKNNLPYNEVNNLSNFPNMLNKNNILFSNSNNFAIDNSNINIPNQNNIYNIETILKEQNNNTNINVSNNYINKIESNTNKNELICNQDKFAQKLNYNLGYNNQIISNNNINNSFECNYNSNFLLGSNDINSLKEIDKKSQYDKLNENSFINDNEIVFEKNYVNSAQKKILFFNENFMKSLELINSYNLNSYNENRSTIYTFPCYESYNNCTFYVKAIEECKNSERFNIDDDLYNKIFSKNNGNEMTFLKNINVNEKLNIKSIDLNIYYPLLHAEKIKFRQPITTDISNKPINNNFELGKIPEII